MGQNQSGDEEEDEEDEVELRQIQTLYAQFIKKCPSGALHLHEFRNMFGIHHTSEEESLYMETLFRSFDTNRDNVIDFMEFVAAVHLVLRGRPEERLKWTFKIYDRDGNGKLDKNEVKRIIRILYKIKKVTRDLEGMSPNDICDRIFELVDQNKDGQITLEEFTVAAEKDIWIMDFMKLDVNASRWFKRHFKES